MKGNHPVANSERRLFTRRDSLLNKMEQWAKYFAYVVIIIATLVLIIWQFNILKHPVPRLVAINPVTAIAFIFSGFSFLLLATKTPVPKKILLGRILACIIILIGLLRIISRFSELNIPIDTILFNERLSEESKGNMSNRMASNTAFSFMLLGIALLLLNVETRRKKMPAQIIALIISFIALLSIVGYLYRVNTFYGTLSYVPMAIHTAISFLLLSFAIFFVNPGKGPMGELTSPFTGSFIARFLVPAAIIIPVLLGFLRLQAAWSGIVSLESGAALLVLAIIIIFLVLTWFIVVSLNKRDYLKQETDHALRKSEEQVQTIFNAAPDAVIVMDEEGKIIQWNPKAESILGWSRDEVVGKLLSETIIPDRFREAHQKGMKHFLRTGEGPLLGKIVETCALTKSGNEIDVALNIAASSRIKNRYLFIGFLRDLTGQKKAEEKFKALLDSAPDAMIIANEKGEIVLINQQTETLFGYVRDELIGKPVEILIPDDFRSRHKGHRDQYFSDPKVRAMGAGLELFAMRRDGTKFPVEISLSPLQTEEGLLVSASVRDITDRKKAEEKFRSLLNAAPDATVIVDEKGVIQMINLQTENLFGYSRDEMIGQPVEILIPEELRNKHVHYRGNFFNAPRIRNMGAGIELNAVKKNGTRFPVEISLSPLQTEEGLLVSASVRDITDRKKAEAKFRSLLDAAPDATVIVNEKGEIQMINQQTENLFGYSRDEMIGQPVEILIPRDLRNKHVQHRGDFFRTAKARTMGAGIELNAIKKNGMRFPVEISLSPIQTEEGMLVSASVRDISLRKGLEDKLKKTNAELEAFTYSVSHDLRAPLRGIIGFTAILEEDYSSKLDDEAMRITSVIKNNTLKMGHLIDALLAFSRMGKQEIMKIQINTQKMVHEIVDELVQQNNRHAAIGWNIHALLPVNADINTIRQVWINLISNAIKYSGNKKHPYIEIDSESRDGQIVFSVKDNGVGFDQQYSHKLFKVFQRLHSPEEFEGTGVGLALVEKIVSRHGGKVWAKGEVDKGACFYFSLPL